MSDLGFKDVSDPFGGDMTYAIKKEIGEVRFRVPVDLDSIEDSWLRNLISKNLFLYNQIANGHWINFSFELNHPQKIRMGVGAYAGRYDIKYFYDIFRSEIRNLSINNIID